MNRRTFVVSVAALVVSTSACGPGEAQDTLTLTASVVDGAVTFAWDDLVGTLAVYACDAESGTCPSGSYRDASADEPAWYVVAESYTECTFPELLGPVTYGALPPPAFDGQGTPPQEREGPAALSPGAPFVAVIFTYNGCMASQPVDMGRAEFLAP
jgi:hypothetical protein